MIGLGQEDEIEKITLRPGFGGMMQFTMKRNIVWNCHTQLMFIFSDLGHTQLMFTFSDLGQPRVLSFSECLVVYIMTHLFGAKPMPMVTYVQLKIGNRLHRQLDQNAIIFVQGSLLENVFWILDILFQPQCGKEVFGVVSRNNIHQKSVSALIISFIYLPEILHRMWWYGCSVQNFILIWQMRETPWIDKIWGRFKMVFWLQSLAANQMVIGILSGPSTQQSVPWDWVVSSILHHWILGPTATWV